MKEARACQNRDIITHFVMLPQLFTLIPPIFRHELDFERTSLYHLQNFANFLINHMHRWP